MQRLWSEEALTAAVLPRYHVDVAVKRALGAKLGTLRKKSDRAQSGVTPKQKSSLDYPSGFAVGSGRGVGSGTSAFRRTVAVGQPIEAVGSCPLGAGPGRGMGRVGPGRGQGQARGSDLVQP
jgi:hypothetical protein